MDEGTALVWQGKGRCNVSFLQRATVDARLRELCDRLVNEVEGLWRPFLFAAGSKPVELVVEGASQECGSSRCHRVVLPGWTCRLTQHDLSPHCEWYKSVSVEKRVATIGAAGASTRPVSESAPGRTGRGCPHSLLASTGDEWASHRSGSRWT